ncbi:hypothetical protein GCM10022210_13650 [Mucilaginibacter dorajii]|uniref:Uncharacterized protein n=1 Tax=Mucilaginibacter dorajii TaxID=692994 RepID=A0ABP7PL38_9SPHI
MVSLLSTVAAVVAAGLSAVLFWLQAAKLPASIIPNVNFVKIEALVFIISIKNLKKFDKDKLSLQVS